jgi:cell shape-determining protein MreC
MTMYDRSASQPRWSSPALQIGALLAIAVLLTLLPAAWSAALKRPVQWLLRPGLAVAMHCGESVDHCCARLRGVLSDSAGYADLERRLEECQTQNAQLRAAAFAAWQQAAEHRSDDFAWLEPTKPLISLRLVEARVLGRRAQSLLERAALLEVGVQDGVRSEDWVVDGGPAVLDQGASAELAAGHLVLAGRRILGKLTDTAASISHVRRATDPGYRDLVQLAYRNSEQWSPGPRALLEGTGEPLCRIRLVPVTQAVSVGDVVLLAGAEGVLPHALVYGQIVRVERPAGATHWELWMQPALSDRWPESVAVVTTAIDGIRSSPMPPK